MSGQRCLLLLLVLVLVLLAPGRGLSRLAQVRGSCWGVGQARRQDCLVLPPRLHRQEDKSVSERKPFHDVLDGYQMPGPSSEHSTMFFISISKGFG